MSSDIFRFEDLYDDYSSSELASFSDANLDFYSDPLHLLPDSPSEIIQQILDEAHNNINPVVVNETDYKNNNLDDKCSYSLELDQIGPAFFSSSPPSHKMQNLSLSQTPLEEEEKQLPHFQLLSNYLSSSNGSNYVAGYSSSYGTHQSNGGGYDNSSSAHTMQRSFSTKSLDGRHEHFHGNVERKCSSFQAQFSHSPDNSFIYGHVRRVCSTGDLTNLVSHEYKSQCSFSTSSLGNGFCNSAEAPLKMGKYTADERRERIDRYRAKRSLRNFNKTIKYVCRKTLADNRPRIKGRFARNEDAADNPNNAIYEDGIWVEGLHARSYEEEMIMSGGQFLNGFGLNHFQYHGYS